MFSNAFALKQHIKQLITHLEDENPLLLDVVKSFRQLDKVAYRIGLLGSGDSYAMRVPWWPMIAVLGTFSSGKSSFINHYLGENLQSTGNQAVDDRFTVICHGTDNTTRTLPGLALDADPRFPFYKMSSAIDTVTAGDGRRIDAFLQIKISYNKALRGRILIDSPGFDADDQRNATLRIADHIIDLADLVLVFFDARHPEPGAMQDTLKHLVANTIHRTDSSKFLFILNQIDNAAREDNPEEVFGAWQRALAQKGLTAGRMYTIYNPDAAVPIEDPAVHERFKSKRAEDIKEIYTRMHQVEVERAYRIIGMLERNAKDIEQRIVPVTLAALSQWRRRVLWADIVGIAILVSAFGWLINTMGWWAGGSFTPLLPQSGTMPVVLTTLAAVIVGGATVYAHQLVRRVAARSVVKRLSRNSAIADIRDDVLRVFEHNTQWWRSAWFCRVAGWSGGARQQIDNVRNATNDHVQHLNSRFTDPSGPSEAGRNKSARDLLSAAELGRDEQTSTGSHRADVMNAASLQRN